MTVAAATTAAVMLSGATPAFAGWSAKPAKATTAQTTDANAACDAKIAQLPGSAWAAVATDVRGEYTLVAYMDSAKDIATCLTGGGLFEVDVPVTHPTTQTTVPFGPSPTGSTRPGTSVGAQPIFAPPPSDAPGTQLHGGVSDFGFPDGVDLFVENQYAVSGQGDFNVAYGQLEPGITAVTLKLSDGTTVDTTIDNGWLLAWWPGDALAMTAAVTTANGTSNVTVDWPGVG